MNVQFNGLTANFTINFIFEQRFYKPWKSFYTDGACLRNGQPDSEAACAYYLNEGCKKSWIDPTPRPTNQSAELGAAYGGIRRAWKSGFGSIILRTDSEYVINCITVWPYRSWSIV